MTITIPDNDARIQYTATAGQTVFPYDFPINAEADLVIIKEGVTLTLTTDYTVSGVGVQAGGNVTLVTGATLNDVVTIYRDEAIARTSNFNVAGDFLAGTLNDQLNSITRWGQQLERDIERTVKLDPQDTASELVLPTATTRASKFLAFDGSGNAIAASGTISGSPIPVSAFGETLLDDASASAARTTLGLGAVSTENTLPVTKGGTGFATATTGDIVYASGSNTLAKLSIGSTGQVLTVSGGIPSWSTSTSFIVPDFLVSGGVLTNNGSDATNDIDISSGSAVSDDGTTLMTFSALTKRLDASWAVGTNQGGLDTGSIGNNKYYVWVINRPDTNVTDVLFSLSSTSPTMPTNYTKKKLIGAFERSGGAIISSRFLQANGTNYLFTSEQQSTDTSGTKTTAHMMLSLPVDAWLEVVCTTAQDALSIGDRFQIRGSQFYNGTNNSTSGSCYWNSTNVVSVISGNGLVFNGTLLTDSNFKLVHRARWK